MVTSEQLHRYSIVQNWITKHYEFQRRIIPGSILDIGCHNGYLCRELSKLGTHVTGIDLYDLELQQAEKDIWTYIQQDLNQVKQLPFANESFSVVTALEILEHIIDTDFFLLEVSRVLKPGGIFCLSTPNINMLKNRLRVPLGLYPYGLEWHTVIHHVRLYNLKTLCTHLQQSGFKIIEYRGTHLLPSNTLRHFMFLKTSNWLSKRLGQLSSNIMVYCEKL